MLDMLVVSFATTVVAVVLLTIGVFLPHWFHPVTFTTPASDVTYSLWHSIRCTEPFLCFATDATDRVLPLNPTWLLIGRAFLILGLIVLIVALIMHIFPWLCPGWTLKVVIMSLQGGSGLLIFIGSFIFVGAFRQMTDRALETPGSLFYEPLPIGFTLLASLGSVFAALASGLNLYPPNPSKF